MAVTTMLITTSVPKVAETSPWIRPKPASTWARNLLRKSSRTAGSAVATAGPSEAVWAGDTRRGLRNVPETLGDDLGVRGHGVDAIGRVLETPRVGAASGQLGGAVIGMAAIVGDV